MIRKTVNISKMPFHIILKQLAVEIMIVLYFDCPFVYSQ